MIEQMFYGMIKNDKIILKLIVFYFKYDKMKYIEIFSK